MDFSFEEITYGLFEFESCLIQFFEDDLNVFEMLLLIPAENNDVVRICHFKLTTVLQNKRSVVQNMQVPVLVQRELHQIYTYQKE